MLCPYCGNSETKVTDKRDSESEAAAWRRRECLRCKKRFTTYERVEAFELMVVKKGGRRERFSRDKLKIGLQKACEKRPISDEEIEKVVNQIEAELRKKGSAEVSSKAVGELAIKKLKNLDKVAYIRFASVYHEFKDLDSFEKEVHALMQKRRRK
jgi:transcriptional repressor NrdR